MDKPDALKYVARKGYDVGFGAKKHFATFDIVEKIPGIIGFVSILFGIISSNYIGLGLAGHASVLLTIFGVVSVYISLYLPDSKSYDDSGKKLTRIYDKLHMAYLRLQSDEVKPDIEIKAVNIMMDEFSESSISKQILFSDWYAHYKFFGQSQTNWIEEELELSFFKDKLPASFYLFLFMVVIAIIFTYFMNP